MEEGNSRSAIFNLLRRITCWNSKVDVPLNRYRIRTASLRDLHEICIIEDDSFPDPYPAFLFKRLLRDYSGTFYVATDDAGKLVGYCVSSLSGKSAHLISICVLREHRRNGVASALLHGLIRDLELRGVEELWLEVNPENTEAICLYGKFGFKKVMVLQDYYSDGSPALKMRSVLRTSVPELAKSER